MTGRTVLAISGDRVEARVAASILMALGHSGDVVDRWAVSDGKVERGAVLEIYSDPNGESIHGVTVKGLRKLWRTLRDTFQLECAWLERGDYAGCILEAPEVARFPLQSETTARVLPGPYASDEPYRAPQLPVSHFNMPTPVRRGTAVGWPSRHGARRVAIAHGA